MSMKLIIISILIMLHKSLCHRFPRFKPTIASNFIGASLALSTTILQPMTAFAVSFKEFTSTDNSIHFVYPPDFVVSEKPVKTHGYEAYLKSEKFKGYNEGITVDRVKIDNILKFASPKELGDKVIAVEKGKDGVFDAELIRYGESTSRMNTNYPAYELEYKVESSRGNNHYTVKTSVINKNLYVFTVQSKETDVEALKGDTAMIVSSVHVDLP